MSGRAGTPRSAMPLAAAVALAALSLLFAPAQPRAQDALPQPEAGQTMRRTPTLRNEVYEKLAAAQRAAEAADYAAAERMLAALQKDFSGTRALNSYELANVHNFYAFIYYSQQKYPEAIRAYEKVLAQPDLPEAMRTGTRYSLAQLYVAVEDWKRAAATLEAWFRDAPNPAPEAYMLLAQANYQVKRYQRALANVEQGLAEARKRRQEPRENWYLLQRLLCYETGDLGAPRRCSSCWRGAGRRRITSCSSRRCTAS